MANVFACRALVSPFLSHSPLISFVFIGSKKKFSAQEQGRYQAVHEALASKKEVAVMNAALQGFQTMHPATAGIPDGLVLTSQGVLSDVPKVDTLGGAPFQNVKIQIFMARLVIGRNDQVIGRTPQG